MLRVCKVCGELKQPEEFEEYSPGKRRSTCRACRNKAWRDRRDPEKERQRSKDYYQTHKEQVIERTKRWGKTHRKERRKSVQDMRARRRFEIQEYKRKAGCFLCGETDPAALDFHHLDNSQKEDNIAELVLSRQKLEKELEKCIVLCSNCHRKVHFYGYRKFPKLLQLMEEKGLAENTENTFDE